MKEVLLTLAQDGSVSVEFGGELEGVCCGKEDKELREALKKLGVDAKLKTIHCKLPQSVQVQRIAQGIAQNGKDDDSVLQKSLYSADTEEQPKIVCNLFYPLQIVAVPARRGNKSCMTLALVGERRQS